MVSPLDNATMPQEVVVETLVSKLANRWLQTVERLSKLAHDSPDARVRAFYFGASVRLATCASQVLDALEKSSGAKLLEQFGIHVVDRRREEGIAKWSSHIDGQENAERFLDQLPTDEQK